MSLSASQRCDGVVGDFEVGHIADLGQHGMLSTVLVRKYLYALGASAEIGNVGSIPFLLVCESLEEKYEVVLL